MNCPYCGSQIADNSMSCPYCGSSLAGGGYTTAQAQTQQTYVQPVQPQSPYMQSNPSWDTSQNYSSQAYPDMSCSQSSGNGDESRIGFWLKTLFLQCIPIVGIIMLFAWAFGRGSNLARKSYARAILIFGLIISGVSLILSIVLCTTGVHGALAYRNYM